MEIKIGFPGGKKVTAEFDAFRVVTDQSAEAGGEGEAPAPFELFLASLGTCAGIFALGFCQKRGIGTKGMELLQKTEWDPALHLVTKITLELRLPAGFPEKYRDPIVSAMNLCTVKRHLQTPPRFEIVALAAPLTI